MDTPKSDNDLLTLRNLENKLDKGKNLTKEEKLMQECKAGYNLAYGKKVEDYKYLLSLKSTENILCCILSDLSKISFTP